MGRPTKYTDELGQRIAHYISTTSLGLNTICKMPDVNLNHDTVRAWIANKEHPFSDLYIRAKDIQIELIAEEIMTISDDGSNDLMRLTKPNGEQYEQENKEVTSRSKLRVESRKWLLSKLNPKKYGERVEVAGDASAPIAMTVTGFKVI